jgi:hypothetical protein
MRPGRDPNLAGSAAVPMIVQRDLPVSTDSDDADRSGRPAAGQDGGDHPGAQAPSWLLFP